MPIIATDTPRFSNLVKHEYEPSLAYCREVIPATHPVGTVLGKVTATGAWVVAKESAADGSKVPAAVVVETDGVKSIAFVRGPATVSKGALKLDATYNDATKKATAYAALEAKGILVNETI